MSGLALMQQLSKPALEELRQTLSSLLKKDDLNILSDDELNEIGTLILFGVAESLKTKVSLENVAKIQRR